jgi:hypothetical protein
VPWSGDLGGVGKCAKFDDRLWLGASLAGTKHPAGSAVSRLVDKRNDFADFVAACRFPLR